MALCLPGTLTDLRCFVCKNQTDMYNCDYFASVETCPDGQVSETKSLYMAQALG